MFFGIFTLPPLTHAFFCLFMDFIYLFIDIWLAKMLNVMLQALLFENVRDLSITADEDDNDDEI